MSFHLRSFASLLSSSLSLRSPIITINNTYNHPNLLSPFFPNIFVRNISSRNKKEYKEARDNPKLPQTQHQFQQQQKVKGAAATNNKSNNDNNNNNSNNKNAKNAKNTKKNNNNNKPDLKNKQSKNSIKALTEMYEIRAKQLEVKLADERILKQKIAMKRLESIELKRHAMQEIRGGIAPKPFGVYKFVNVSSGPLESEKKKKELDPTQKNNKHYLKKDIKWIFMDITPNVTDEARQIVVTGKDGTFKEADATIRAKALSKYSIKLP